MPNYNYQDTITTRETPVTISLLSKAVLVAQLDGHPTGDQEVVGLTPTGVAIFFRGD